MSLSFRTLVVVVLSLLAISGGIFFIFKAASVREVISEIPGPFGELEVLVSVEPERAQQGSSFLVKARYAEVRDQQDLSLRVESEGFLSLLTLYDDGNHFDGSALDGVYGGLFDSAEKDFGVYDLRREPGGESLASFTIFEEGCEVILGDPSEENINFVMLPSGYDSYDDFLEDAEDVVTGSGSFFSIEPFKSNQQTFSFSVVNTTRDLECKNPCQGVSTVVCCNNKAVIEEASHCPHDSIVVLLNDDKLCGSASTYAKVCAKNELSSLVLVHEMGHSFAGLADEYVYQGYNIGEVEAPNCASDCDDWLSITDGCFEGCTYSSLFRPSRRSIMSTYIPVFNLVSIVHIEDLILKKFSVEREVEQALPSEQSYLVNLLYDNGSLSIGAANLIPIKAAVSVLDSEFAAEIVSFDGDTLFRQNIVLPIVIDPLPNTAGVPIIQQQFEYPIILPYAPDAEVLNIQEDNVTVATTSLAVFSDTCGNGRCDGVENHLSCRLDCSIKGDNFCQTSTCDPDCPDQERCETAPQRFRNAAIILILTGILGFVIFLFFALRKK